MELQGGSCGQGLDGEGIGDEIFFSFCWMPIIDRVAARGICSQGA